MRHLKHVFLAGVLSAGIALGGCASMGGPTGTTGGTTTSDDIQNIITQIQKDSVTACHFLPTGATVVQIIGAASGVGPVTDIIKFTVDKVCDAISPAVSARRGGAAPSLTIDGKTIVIHGRFVK